MNNSPAPHSPPPPKKHLQIHFLIFLSYFYIKSIIAIFWQGTKQFINTYYLPDFRKMITWNMIILSISESPSEVDSEDPESGFLTHSSSKQPPEPQRITVSLKCADFTRMTVPASWWPHEVRCITFLRKWSVCMLMTSPKDTDIWNWNPGLSETDASEWPSMVGALSTGLCC